MPKHPRPQRRLTIKIHINAHERALIDSAAKLRRLNREYYILESALSAAKDALPDSTMISVTPQAYAEFLERLDARPQPNARLRDSMRALAPLHET